MSREIPLNAFHMNTVGHQAFGLWTHPRNRARDYNRLETWVELARTLERGLFDGLFLADGIVDPLDPNYAPLDPEAFFVEHFGHTPADIEQERVDATSARRTQPGRPRRGNAA